jgi:hypothetical protein
VFSSPTIILILFGLGGGVIMMCLLLTRKMDRAQRQVWRTSTIASTLLTLLVVSVLVVLRFFGPAVSPNAFAMVRTGMTEQDVLNLLGEPSGKTAITREEAMRGVATWEHEVRSIWKYQKDGVFEFVEVYFDDDGKVVFKHRDY